MWEGIPILDLVNGSVIQNSFIMKVSKMSFPLDIVIPYESGNKTKHWFLLLRLNMKTEFLRQSTHYLQHEAVMLKQSHFYPHFITRDNRSQLTGIHLVFSHTQDITHLDNDFSECVQNPKIHLTFFKKWYVCQLTTFCFNPPSKIRPGGTAAQQGYSIA